MSVGLFLKLIHALGETHELSEKSNDPSHQIQVR